jgi:MFS family permease
MCGLATEEWVIILGRLVAGAGGGCLNTISTFVGSDLVPLRKRGIWQGIGNIVYGTGMGLGGLFGGAIHDSIGWRWAFLIQVPFIIFAGILSFFTVKVPIKESDTSKIRRVDFLGSFALSVTLVLLLLGLNSGGNLVPWTHPLVLTTLPLSLLALLGFIYIEDRVASEPVIPVRLLAQQTVAAACLTNWFITMAVFALLYYVPIYFQTVLSLSSTAAGARLIPQSVGTALGSLSTGIIMRAIPLLEPLHAISQPRLRRSHPRNVRRASQRRRAVFLPLYERHGVRQHANHNSDLAHRSRRTQTPSRDNFRLVRFPLHGLYDRHHDLVGDFPEFAEKQFGAEVWRIARSGGGNWKNP